jgi:hypothetical protein
MTSIIFEADYGTGDIIKLLEERYHSVHSRMELKYRPAFDCLFFFVVTRHIRCLQS